MSRTKEEMAQVLADRKTSEFMFNSTWGDLVSAVQSQNTSGRDRLIKALREGNKREAGDLLHKALHQNAKQRARAFIDSKLADDSIDMTELDELL